MDKSWDSTGVSFSADTWYALARHMLPGAFGMTYGGARTWHRIAAAIEDAGLIIHPSIFCWIYATGLHKAARIDTWIDRENGVYDDREIIEKSTATYGYQKSGERWAKDHYVTLPASEEAAIWYDYRYGLQALRPAVEPVILFQKPYDGRPLDSIREYGAGALYTESGKYNGGKWPTNFLMVHHPLCTESACHPDCVVLSLGEKAEYFPAFDWSYNDAELVAYNKKALGQERKLGIETNVNHPTMKPLSVNQWLARLLLPPKEYEPRRILVPFGGIMSETIGALLAGWEEIVSVEINEEYTTPGITRVQWWQGMIKKYGPNVPKIIKAAKEDGVHQLSFDL